MFCNTSEFILLFFKMVSVFHVVKLYELNNNDMNIYFKSNIISVKKYSFYDFLWETNHISNEYNLEKLKNNI